MSRDGIGDQRVLLLIERIVAAHHALQLGELADHAGNEIGLGHDRRPLGKIRIGPDERRQFAGQRPNAMHPLILRAQLLVEDDVLQLRHPDFEADIAVLAVEEFASESLAAITRSLPATMDLPPSSASRFAINMN